MPACDRIQAQRALGRVREQSRPAAWISHERIARQSRRTRVNPLRRRPESRRRRFNNRPIDAKRPEVWTLPRGLRASKRSAEANQQERSTKDSPFVLESHACCCRNRSAVSPRNKRRGFRRSGVRSGQKCVTSDSWCARTVHSTTGGRFRVRVNGRCLKSPTVLSRGPKALLQVRIDQLRWWRQVSPADSQTQRTPAWLLAAAVLGGLLPTRSH
jgi:hypothetical protein